MIVRNKVVNHIFLEPEDIMTFKDIKTALRHNLTGIGLSENEINSFISDILHFHSLSRYAIENYSFQNKIGSTYRIKVKSI